MKDNGRFKKKKENVKNSRGACIMCHIINNALKCMN